MARQLLPLPDELFRPGPVLLHHFLRRPLYETLVVEPAAQLLQLRVGRRDLFFDPRLLRRKVDQPLERQVDLHLRLDVHGCLPRTPCLGLQELDRRRVGQMLERLRVLVQQRPDLLVSGNQNDGHPLVGRQVHFPAHRPRSVDGAEDQVHLLLRRNIDELRPRDRKRRHHDRRPRLVGQPLPDLLGDEGHEGMQEAQRSFQRGEQRRLRARAFGRRLLAVERGLGQLDGPIAQLVPDEAVDAARRVAQPVFVERRAGLVGAALKAAQDPAVVDGGGPGGEHGGGHGRRRRIRVHEDEAGRVPDLVCERAVARDAIDRELDVAALPRHRGQREAQRVGAVLRGEVERVDDVALRFRHLLALLVAHHGVEKDGLEGHFSEEVQAQHGHAGDPEEEDVEARLHDGVRIEGVQRPGLLRPAQRRERPQTRAEPGVQHVGILRELPGAAIVTDRRLLAGDADVAALAVPGRDLVSPPELPRDAPVVEVDHPAQELPAPVLGHEAHLVDVRDDVVGERPRLHEPLLAEQRLDHAAAALALAQREGVRFGAALETQLGEAGLQRRADLDAVLALERTRVGVQRSVEVQDVDERQVVSLAGLEVLEAVARRDLHRAGAELRVDQLGVGDDGKLAPRDRMPDVLADQALVARIVRVDGDGGVAQHRLDASGGDDNLPH